MFNKIKNHLNKNRIIKIIIIIIMIPILVYIANILFKGGINFGTFIRKLIELTSCK